METETTAPLLDPTLIRPSSGKDTAKTKGVHREVESEGRWQISVLGRHTDSGSILFSRRVFCYEAVRLVADIRKCTNYIMSQCVVVSSGMSLSIASKASMNPCLLVECIEATKI